MAEARIRLAVVADIHGNLAALEAVCADLASRGVAAVVNLGDCVSGPLWPRETLARLQALGWPTVRGNHDRWVGAAERTASLGASDAFAAAEVGRDGRAWLAALPMQRRPGNHLLAVHARPDRDDAYLLEDVADGRLRPAAADRVASRLGGATETLVLTGHSHQAGLLSLDDGRTIVNPGSVGCPAYDDPGDPAHVSETGSPLARYAVLAVGPSGAVVEAAFLALAYDHAAAARRASAQGRPDWAHALTHGTMPR